MARVVPSITAFNWGEWAPILHGRTDLERYTKACAELRNFLPLAQGAITRRPGTRWAASTKSDGEVRLIPFEFSTTAAYVIEAGASYFRFYTNGARLESAGVPVEVVTPYSVADLATVQNAQSADVLFLAHPSHQPRTLTRTSPTAFSLTAPDFTDGPYLDERVDITVTPSATTGSVTLTASAPLFDAARDVGRAIRLRHSTTWGWARITAVGGATSATATVGTAFAATTGSLGFRLGAWYTSNWPTAVTFFQNRLWWAGTPLQPQTVWGSKTGDFYNHAPGAAADDGVSYTLADDAMNAIRWMKAQKVLVVGTAGGEFVLSGSGAEDAVTPSNVLVVPQPSGVGSAAVGALVVGGGVIFVQRAGRKVHLLELDAVTQGSTYTSPDLSLYAPHLTRAGVKQLAWQQEPWRVLWCVMNDGSLLAFTFMQAEQVAAWSRHPVGGTSAAVESVAVIPAAGYSELWLAVRRTVNGATVRHVERMAEDFKLGGGVVQADAYFLDAGLTYSGAPATVFGGLGHLIGQTVDVLADGAAHPPVVVDGSGNITLTRAASKVHAGLGYLSRVETLDIAAGAQDGSSMTRRRSISTVGLQFVETLGAWVGWRGEDGAFQMQELFFRTPAMPMDAPPLLFTGVREEGVPSRWESAANVAVEQRLPLPMTLTAIVPRMQTGE